MSSDAENVYYIAADGVNRRQLVQISRETQEITLTDVDIPRSKVFKIDDQFYAPAQVEQDFNGIGTYAGLYGEGYKLKQGSLNHDVSDVLNENILWLALT